MSLDTSNKLFEEQKRGAVTIRRKAIATAKVLVGIGLIIAVSWNVDFSGIGATMSQAGPITLAIALLFFFLSRFLEGIRLYVLSHKAGCRIRAALEIIFISTFFNNFAVSIIGDGYKVISLSKYIKSWQVATVLVVIERLLGIIAIVCIGLFVLLTDSQSMGHLDALAVPWERRTLFFGAGFVLLLLVIGVAVLWWRRRDIASLIVAVRKLAAAVSPWQIGMSLLLTILAQIALAAMVFGLLLALGASLRFSENLLVMLVVFVAAFVPITIGSLGVREGAIVIGLGWFGVPAAIALSAALISRGLIYFCAGVAGVWWLCFAKTR